MTLTPMTDASQGTHSTESRRDSIKPLFAVGGLYSLSNGVAWAMRDLASALGRAGSPVDIYGADCWGRGGESVGHIFTPPSRWLTSPGLWLGGLSYSPQLKWKLNKAVAGVDIVHNHSVWMLPNHYSSRAAQKHKKPIVISAHGTLEPWAVKHSGWKKKLVAAWFQDQDLHRADCLIVLKANEIEGIRQYGLKNPIAVIPNGVHIPDLDQAVSPEVFFERFPKVRGKRIALFMARVHEKKGLGHLLPAFGRLAGQFPEWHLVIAGPDCGDLDRAKRIVSDFKIQDKVTFTGALQGEIKVAARKAAEVFLQPSFSEGFSLSIIEAMACRLPVLLTPGCNFPEAEQAGAAISVNPTIDHCEQGLRELFAKSPDELQAMGHAGRNLIQSRYQWDAIAEDTLALYRWIIHGGPSPAFVDMA